MVFRLAYRSIRCKPVLAYFLPRPASYIYSPVQYLHHSCTTTSIFQLRHIVAVAGFPWLSDAVGLRNLSTHQTTSSLNDPNPNWSNRPPKETILLDGCDFEHWLVVMEKPPEEWTRDQIIDYYIKTLASVIGSEEEARMKIYSVSTRCYFAFGALVSEELSYKIKELPKVRWVLPDSYLNVKNKDYGGEPFINGQAVPYDPKYHEEWIRNNSQAMMRNERNKRRGFDRRNRRDIQSQPPSSGMPYRDSTVPNMGGAQQPTGQSGGMQFNPNSPPGLSGNPQPSAAGMQFNAPPAANPGYSHQLNNPGSNMQFNARGPPSYGRDGPQPTGTGIPPMGNPGFLPQSNNTGGGMPNAGGPQQPNRVGDMPQSSNMGWRPQSPQSGGMGWTPQSNNMNPTGQFNQTGRVSHSAGMGWGPQSQVAGGPPQANITGTNYHPGNMHAGAQSNTGRMPQFNDRWPASSTGNPPQFNIGQAPPRPCGQQNDSSGTPNGGWPQSRAGNAPNFQNFGDPTQETKDDEPNKTTGQ